MREYRVSKQCQPAFLYFCTAECCSVPHRVCVSPAVTVRIAKRWRVGQDKIRIFIIINPLNMKRRMLYLKTQFVPRSKHFSSRL